MKKHRTLIGFIRLFFAITNKKFLSKLLIFSSILLLPNLIYCPLAARAESTEKPKIKVNLEASDEKSPPPTLSLSTSSNPEGLTTSIIYKIFSFRKLPIIFNETEYDRIEVSDCGFSSAPGAPELPVRTIFLEFPDNPKLKNYKIDTIAVKTHKIENMLLLPAQLAPPEESEPSFTINQKIYQSRNPYPASRILSEKIIKLRQRHLLEIRFTPVLFKPLLKEIDFAYEIKLNVSFTADTRRKTIPAGPKLLKP